MENPEPTATPPESTPADGGAASPVAAEAAERCVNCGSALDDRYCPRCGQRKAQSITFARVTADAAEQLVSLDSALVRTMVGLARSPGRLVRRYLDGQRKTYMNPMKFVFVAATVFALTINVFDVLPHEIPPDRPQAIRLFKTLVSALGYLAYLYMLPAAVVQRWLFRRHELGVAECYVSLLYYYGEILLLGSVLAALGLYSIPYGMVAIRGLGMLYLAWMLTGLYRGPKATTLGKAVLVYVTFTVVNIGTGILVALALRLL